MTALTDLMPQHAASLHLTHNNHLACYLTVQQAIDDADFGYTPNCWVSEEQKQKAIETNDCWFVQWYPNTPVGFCLLAGADLDVVLKAARESE